MESRDSVGLLFNAVTLVSYVCLVALRVIIVSHSPAFGFFNLSMLSGGMHLDMDTRFLPVIINNFPCHNLAPKHLTLSRKLLEHYS